MRIITIGRSSSNDIKLDDPYVGRHHCQIVQQDNGTYSIVDLNSTNGTFVNGNRIYGESQLQPSDSVTVGNSNISWMSYFTPIPTPQKHKSNALPAILISIGGVLLLGAAVAIFWWLTWGQKTIDMCEYEPATIIVPKGTTLENALLKKESQMKDLKKVEGTGGAKLIAETSADLAEYYHSCDYSYEHLLVVKPLHDLKMHIDTTPICLFHRMLKKEVLVESRNIWASTSSSDNHYMVDLYLKNNTDKALSVVVDQGSMIESEALDAQSLVVTERQEVTLAPHQKYRISVPAYSASQHRNSPVGTQGRITPYVMNAPSEIYQSQGSIWYYQQAPANNKITFYKWSRGDRTRRGEKSKTGHVFVGLQHGGYWGFGSQDGELFDSEGSIVDHRWLKGCATDSCSIYVTDMQINQALSKLDELRNSTKSYYFYNYSCTSFVKEIADAAEVYYGQRVSIKGPDDFMKNLKRFNKSKN